MNLHFGLTHLPTTLFRDLKKMPFEGMNRHFGVTNTPTTFTRCLRRMRGFEGFWFSYRTSSAETSVTQGNAISWQNRSDLRSARARNDQPWRAHSAVTSRAHASFSTRTPYGSGRIDAIRNHEQIREFCQFLAHEWRGNRHHSYAVPPRGKSSAWSRTVDGKWSAVGLADAVSKYAWSGKTFSENKAELDELERFHSAAVSRRARGITISNPPGIENRTGERGTAPASVRPQNPAPAYC